MPVGTGTLFVQNTKWPGTLVRERRAQNCTETYEALVVQYLALEGYRQWSPSPSICEPPVRVISSLHAGPGQQTFGSSREQRCDLLVCFARATESTLDPTTGTLTPPSPARLVYHNFHGMRWHYDGHSPSCPQTLRQREARREFRKTLFPLERPDALLFEEEEEDSIEEEDDDEFSFVDDNFVVKMKPESEKLDKFRKLYASAMSAVRPHQLSVEYTHSLECDYFHGGVRRPWMEEPSERMSERSLAELLERDYSPNNVVLLPFCRGGRGILGEGEIIEGIKSRRLTGFVTISGGQETPTGDACDSFGFCVQKYAPQAELGELSEYTREQMIEYHGWRGNQQQQQQQKQRTPDDNDDDDEEDTNNCEKQVLNFMRNQPARTLNSGTFHGQWETVSTSYLRWLMLERGFSDFKISHFLRYAFSDRPSREFLEPLLQARHDYKKQGNTVAAECLKLIGNGSFGYNGLESCNYDSVRLLTGSRLRRTRDTLMSHLSLKHITMIGVVRQPVDKKKKKKKHTRGERRATRVGEFISAEAAVADEDDDDDDDDDDDTQVCSITDAVGADKRKTARPDKSCLAEGFDEKLVDLSCSDESAVSTDYFDDSDTDEGHTRVYESSTSDDTEDEDNGGDLNELAVRGALASEHSYTNCSSRRAKSSSGGGSKRKHSEMAALQTKKLGGKKKYRYDFLYSVVVSGREKTIKNCLPKAVAILSNSKVVFLGHIRTMLECLEPGLAELCYIDTDSAIFSTTYAKLEDCMQKRFLEKWKSADLVANESGENSCHGKLMCEGVYQAAKFKSLKVYRLYGSGNTEDIDADQTQQQQQQRLPCYTRCKGVSRWIATQLPEEAFLPENLERFVIHRSCLRPARTGEMLVAHESRSMTAPFNLKRLVTQCGYHSFPLSDSGPSAND